jgi:hypothetical protein
VSYMDLSAILVIWSAVQFANPQDFEGRRLELT